MNVRASAPGKLVLLGEYAVIDGAPALVAAVDRRAVAGVEVVDGELCEVYAPDVSPRPARFALSAGGCFEWRSGAGEARRHALARFVVESLIAEKVLDPAASAAFRVSLDSAGFFLNGTKLGLGSSAALVVTLDAALRRHAGADETLVEPERALDRLIALHAAFQRGRGSGLDVAASLFGGLLAFAREGGTGAARVGRLRWPAGLHMLCLWSGCAASTHRLLRAAEHARRSRPRVFATHVARLARLAQDGQDAVNGGNAGRLLGIVESYAEALDGFGQACGIDIMSPGHRRLRQLAAAAGAAYKPSGAGGGDVGVAFAAAGEPLAALSEVAVREGSAVVSLGMDPEGLRFR